MQAWRWLAFACVIGGATPCAGQQINAARLAILEAEDRRAPAAADLVRLRAGVASGDPQTARLAVRALGRLERPALIPDILPALASVSADVREEAANAAAQAAHGLRRGNTGGPTMASLLQTLRTRLADEENEDTRAAMAESLARLPYEDSASLAGAQQALLDVAGEYETVADTLGVAKAFEVLVRAHERVTLLPPAVSLLRGFLGIAPAPAPAGAVAEERRNLDAAARAARVRRLAFEALVNAGALDAALINHAGQDGDAQVRRIAMRAAARLGLELALKAGLDDPAAMVRLEAVRGLADSKGDDVCGWILAATADADVHVVLQALDQLHGCGQWEPVVTRLADLAGDVEALRTPRGWHRGAHALVALAAAAPARAASMVHAHAASTNPFVRVYAARAAQRLNDRPLLERLAADPSDNVVESAVDGLSLVAKDAAAAVYASALARRGYQAVRAAARALSSCPPTAPALAALRSAHERLLADGSANSTDARRAVEEALTRLGATPATTGAARRPPPTVDPTIDELRRLAAPRARLTIRDVGVIDIALIAVDAPLTVVTFARLADAGYYNGLTVHRVAANFVLQGGSPDANEYVGHRDYMRDEVGLWPHVRGTLGISTRGRDTGDAQFFIDLLDNPRLDHEYTVFAQVLAGMDVADRVLEGDVIESVQILTR